MCTPGRIKILISHWEQSALLTSPAEGVGLSPPHPSLARAESGALGQSLGSRGVACMYIGGLRT